jgi:hypothetical protein
MTSITPTHQIGLILCFTKERNGILCFKINSQNWLINN